MEESFFPFLPLQRVEVIGIKEKTSFSFFFLSFVYTDLIEENPEGTFPFFFPKGKFILFFFPL